MMTPPGQIAHYLLLVLNAEGPLTLPELVDETDLEYRDLRQRIWMLRKRNGDALIYIHHWEQPERGHAVPVFMAGPGVSAAKPRPLTAKEHAARFRERHPMRRLLDSRLQHGGKPIGMFQALMK